RLTPGRPVAVIEVRAVRGQHVPRRPEVVVHDVDDDGEPSPVARVDEALQPLGPPVRVVRSEREHAVVAPPAPPGELGQRHELHRRRAQLDEVVEPGHHAVEGPWAAERPHVELVEDRRREGRGAPPRVVPGERRVVHGTRRPLGPVRLPRRPGVGERCAAIEAEAVVRGRLGAAHVDLEPPAAGGAHRGPVPGEVELDGACPGRPHPPGRHASLTSRPTGNPSSSAATPALPECTAPVNWSRHVPGGSSTVVPAHPPARAKPTVSRGATVTAHPPRANATTWSAAGPRTSMASYRPASPWPNQSGWARRTARARATTSILGAPDASVASHDAWSSPASTARRSS